MWVAVKKQLLFAFTNSWFDKVEAFSKILFELNNTIFLCY